MPLADKIEPEFNMAYFWTTYNSPTMLDYWTLLVQGLVI